MTKKIVIGAVIFSLIIVIIGCSAPTAATMPAQKPVQTPATVATTAPVTVPAQLPPSNPKPAGMIKAKWIEPQINEGTVFIPVKEVINSWNAVFKTTQQSGTRNYMVYILDGELYVRASTCPPCRGITYSLDGDTLVCDACGTTFKAKNGAGIKGPCVNFPKAAVQFKIVDGNIVMSETDLANAYQETLKPG